MGFRRHPHRLWPVDAGERCQLFLWLLYPLETHAVTVNNKATAATRNTRRICVLNKVFVKLIGFISIVPKALKTRITTCKFAFSH